MSYVLYFVSTTFPFHDFTWLYYYTQYDWLLAWYCCLSVHLSVCLSVMKCIVVLRVGVGGWKLYHGPCGARGCCRISPPRFLAECRKRWLNGGSFVSAVCLVVFFDLYCVYLCIFVIYIEFFPYCLFVSNSQVTGCKDHLRNDLYTVGWGVKLDSIQSKLYHHVPRVALP